MILLLFWAAVFLHRSKVYLERSRGSAWTTVTAHHKVLKNIGISTLKDFLYHFVQVQRNKRKTFSMQVILPQIIWTLVRGKR